MAAMSIGSFPNSKLLIDENKLLPVKKIFAASISKIQIIFRFL